MPGLLVFDDLKENRDRMADGLRAELNDICQIEFFLGEKFIPEGQSYERCIEEHLCASDFAEQIALVACDKELGLYENYRGLSANAVSVVARNLGIPFCQYSRNAGASERQLERFQRLRRWDSE